MEAGALLLFMLKAMSRLKPVTVDSGQKFP